MLVRLLGLALLLPVLACTDTRSDDDDAEDDDDDAADNDDDTADDDDTAPDDDDSAGDSWAALRSAIDASALEDVTLLIGTAEGTVFSHSRGKSAPDTVYPLASASKWLSAITLLTLVEDGTLNLDESFQQHLPWWTEQAGDPRLGITLEQLLSFTSGFSGGIDGVPCVEDGSTTLSACAEVIHDDFHEFAPGTGFYYGPSHLQVAGAAAAAVTGRRFNRIWRDQVADSLGLPTAAAYAIPSLENPRVAGGGTASGQDYAAVLTALLAGDLLGAEMRTLMATDHTPKGVVFEEAPPLAGDAVWHYGLGCWRECGSESYGTECDEPGVLSSPGIFGFYPWWDQARGFWGVLATQTESGAAFTVPLGQQWAELAAAALDE